jgi:hypothetical protein
MDIKPIVHKSITNTSGNCNKIGLTIRNAPASIPIIDIIIPSMTFSKVVGGAEAPPVVTK